MLPQPLEQALQATATIAYTEVSNLAQDLSLPEDEYPLAQILEVYDEDICPLCAWLNGKIIRRGTPEWEKYRLPSHINCRRTFAYIPANADEQPDFEEPPPSLLQKHGHFHTDPLKYEELRVPAFADRRQFIFRRVKDPETGEWRSILQWLAPREGGDAERYLIDSDLIRPGSRLANILASLPRRRPNKALQEFAEQLDAIVDGLRLGAPLHQRIRFNAPMRKLSSLGEVDPDDLEIRISTAQSALLRQTIQGATPTTRHLDAIGTVLHELIQSRSPHLQQVRFLSDSERARALRSAAYSVARRTEEGLVEMWARNLLRNLSEHPISEDNEYDYFQTYNSIVRGWRYLQKHLPEADEAFRRWFLVSDSVERNRLLGRYLQQAMEAHFESLSPTEQQREVFRALIQRAQNPEEWNPVYRALINEDFLSTPQPLWVLFDEKTQPLAQTDLRDAQQFIDWLRSILR